MLFTLSEECKVQSGKKGREGAIAEGRNVRCGKEGRLEEIKRDPALPARGYRKQIVTSPYSGTERPVEEVEWTPGAGIEKCPVLVMADTESAVFTENAKQERHYHAVATEIYLLLDGVMRIGIDNDQYDLRAGDMIAVGPNTWHEVKPGDAGFLCRVITVNCQGASDKYT